MKQERYLNKLKNKQKALTRLIKKSKDANEIDQLQWQLEDVMSEVAELSTKLQEVA
tara:strand:- start:27354 stop:27521 length:168 start_codon:yes stop_codon:yes gene_type:complete